MSAINWKTKRRTDLAEIRNTIAMDEVNARLAGGTPYWNWRLRWSMSKLAELIASIGKLFG